MSARRQPAEEDRVQAGDVNPTYTMDEAATIQSRPAQMAQNTCASLTRRWNMQSGREQKRGEGGREVGKRGRAARTFHEKRATRPHVSWRRAEDIGRGRVPQDGRMEEEEEEEEDDRTSPALST
ncbi:unnamed protein product [Prorocentrum cordatum]|uniref:Uncharacterized protein n=1 Tax=Prorocentrum cordatum TaxID=2364126 RepID=A0ABN9TRI3_9DINO|nr:unnamed protein product [Polarella glacialis]